MESSAADITVIAEKRRERGNKSRSSYTGTRGSDRSGEIGRCGAVRCGAVRCDPSEIVACFQCKANEQADPSSESSLLLLWHFSVASTTPRSLSITAPECPNDTGFLIRRRRRRRKGNSASGCLLVCIEAHRPSPLPAICCCCSQGLEMGCLLWLHSIKDGGGGGGGTAERLVEFSPQCERGGEKGY